jgi:hypothetical protein
MMTSTSCPENDVKASMLSAKRTCAVPAFFVGGVFTWFGGIFESNIFLRGFLLVSLPPFPFVLGYLE